MAIDFNRLVLDGFRLSANDRELWRYRLGLKSIRPSPLRNSQQTFDLAWNWLFERRADGSLTRGHIGCQAVRLRAREIRKQSSIAIPLRRFTGQWALVDLYAAIGVKP